MARTMMCGCWSDRGGDKEILLSEAMAFMFGFLWVVEWLQISNAPGNVLIIAPLLENTIKL